ARRSDLAPRALRRILVRAEAQQPCAVAEAVLLELVEAHLDDELRLERRLFEAVGSPAVRFAEAAVALGVEQGEDFRGDLRLVLCADRGGADVVQLALVAVEAEEERRDRVAAALLPA